MEHILGDIETQCRCYSLAEVVESVVVVVVVGIAVKKIGQLPVIGGKSANERN